MSQPSSSRSPSIARSESINPNLPRYLRVLPQYRVVLCTTHGCCYTLNNLDRHLQREHQVRSHERRQIQQSKQLTPVAISSAGVVQPVDGISEIHGLPTVRGFLCHYQNCDYRSINTDQIRKHYNQVHQWQVLHHGAMPWHEAFLQTLFNQRQNIQYFAVVLADQVYTGGSEPQYIYPHANAPDNAPLPTSPQDILPVPDNTWDQIMYEFQQAQAQPSRQQIDQVQHVSDLTPWMKRTGIYLHLQGLDLGELGPSWKLPNPGQEPLLYLICQSIGRVLETTMNVLVHDQNLESRQLSRRNARLLNTFERGRASQDPFSELQNRQSWQKYTSTWKQLICYWERVVEQGHLREGLFQPSDIQLEAWVEVTEAASKLTGLEDNPDPDPNPEQTSLDQVTCLRDQLDQATRQFSIAIIQHQVPQRKFDSVLVSYAAARFWNPDQAQWLMLGNYTSILSQLIYDCQLVVLAQVLADTQGQPDIDIGARIMEIRDQWLLNDTDGPVAELLENRLLGFQISRSEVPPAQLRWHADGETLVWAETTFHLSDLHTMVFQGLVQAQQLFTKELCLSGQSSPAEEIPALDLRLLVDNWDATSPGQSFLTDTRNSAYLDPLRPWLISRVGQTPVLFHTFFQRNAAGDQWVVSADAAQQYEDAVQRFLRAVLGPIFLGSGQQGRRTEFIALRWKNSVLATRDLFLHDGQMLFILSYHKNRHRSNASRWPVRFLLPEVAHLLVQYLAIIQPFREYLHAKAQVPPATSEYIFSAGKAPWHEDTMTRVIVQTGKQLLGKQIHIQAWRQITIGIARRKLAAPEANMLIEEGEGVDEEEDPILGSLTEAMHWQASHTPHTGNRVYGGSVNFRAGLTDAGLQEFRQVSQLWHQLVRDPLHFQPGASVTTPTPRRMFPVVSTPTTPRPATTWEWDTRSLRTGTPATPSKRRRSQEPETPIARRVARRKAPARTRRRWRMDQALAVLQRMYGADAQYRSPEQQRAMEHVANGAGQVLAILRTSEGKSLLYLLPCQLPGAGTTVLILPLVVLKAEMQRRCAEAGIEAHIWEPRSSPDQLHSCPLIIVAVEQAVRPRFRAFLNQLAVANELDRVVFDECHLAVTALGYRPAMGLLPLLREVECQMVFLTGTMPPSLVPQFEQAMLLQGARMVRSSTTRPDIYFSVTQCPPNEQFTQDFVIPGIQSFVASMEPGTRAIIYCWRKDMAEEIAEVIQAPVYHSTSGSIEEKAAVLQSWRDGDPTYIVATSAFGLGIDHPAVRWVVHIGVPSSMIDFAQEVGRLGRDGGGGQSLVLVPPQWRATVNDRDGRSLGAAEAAMQIYIQTTRCRVQVLARFLDGDDGRGCTDDRLICDHCRDAGTVQIHETPSPAARVRVEDNAQDLQAGAQLLHAQAQRQAQGLAEYILLLETWRGVCMICYHLPRAASGAESHARHSLGACPNPKRFQYFDAKKQAQAQGRGRGGWFGQFNSCYRCYNPQVICDQQGQGRCPFQDVVMPACWAVFQKPGLVQRYLEELRGEYVGHDQGMYMLWLGEGRTVFGEEGSNAVAIAGLVLQQMGSI